MNRFYIKFIVLLLSMIAYVKSFDVPTRCEVKPNRVLDCSRKRLTHLPNFNRYCSFIRSIRELKLSDNNIKNVDLSAFRCFKKLRRLFLDNNKIDTIHLNRNDNAILNKLETLSLDYNNFKTIPSVTLRKLKNLSVLSMQKNRIKRIKNDTFVGVNRLREIYLFSDDLTKEFVIHVEIGAFRYMRSLEILPLASPEVKMEDFPDLRGTKNLLQLSITGMKQYFHVPKTFCQEHKSLQRLTITKSTFIEFPKLKNCSGLEELVLAQNVINYIGKNAFSGLTHLNKIDLSQMETQHLTKVHQHAFKNLPLLTELELSGFPLINFPSFEGTNRLTRLTLSRCKITQIAEDFCSHMPNLKDFHFMNNEIKSLPSLSKCKDLEFLDLRYNQIKTLTDQFKDLGKLLELRLTDNLIQEIPQTLFGSTKRLEILRLSENHIHEIHPLAFANITNLRKIDVSRNFLKQFPVVGLQSVSEIVANGNPQMIDFPTQQELPHAKQLKLDYHYHCCFFLKRVQQVHQRYLTRGLSQHSTFKFAEGDQHNDLLKSLNTPGHLTERNNSSTIGGNGDEIDPMFKLLQQLNNHTIIYIHKPEEDEERNMKYLFEEPGDGYCTPTPNEFYPCEDLMGKEWLRGCVWIVFFLAIIGNITVLVVLLLNFKKLDVPRFLVLNLAAADLFLGIYLGFLAFVDIKTLGDFRSHALHWQFSDSCRFAGFLAVFSSELSVFTLTLITLERFLTLKNAPHIDKRLTKKQCVVIMAFGWMLSILIASLPLINGKVKFNDYTKYSVCLPFETETLASRIYLIFILAVNLSAFIVILFCYIHLYLIIRNSPARNTGDSRAARKMAMLVFTDFFCWFPIALVALSSVFDNPFITDLWVSKVLTILVFPLNACANPFLYAISMKQFRKDIVAATRQLRDKITHRHEIRKSLLKLPIKGSLTYSTSVRRESSCSFLFSRRHSSKPDSDSKYSRNTPIMQPSLQQSFEEPDEDDFQERLTTV